MDYYVWITYRRIRPGSREEFERSWEPADFPGGLLRADAWYSDDGEEIVGVSFWESREAIRAFAGDDIDVARFYPKDERFLVEREETCTHYDVAVA